MAESHNGKEEWKSKIDRARELFSQGVQELNQAAASAKEHGLETWQRAQERAQEAWDEAREKGMESWQDLRERSQEAWQDTEKLVRKYPARAIGVSALVGFLIGLLIAPRERD